MEEMINIPVQIYKEGRCMMSGSYREGFRFKSSDQDYIFWSCDHKLINDISQARLYDRTKHNIILMEDNDTPPGFVKLQLLTSPRGRLITASAVPVNDRVYISSLLWQQESVNAVGNHKGHQRVINHGPCVSGYVEDIEFDYANCIAGTHWPAVTRAWIERCIAHTWPPVAVLEKNCKEWISLCACWQ
jgi:hypothetical protein